MSGRYLWKSLQRLGVHGQMREAVHALYTYAQSAINIGVESSCGIKQGCQLTRQYVGVDGVAGRSVGSSALRRLDVRGSAAGTCGL